MQYKKVKTIYFMISKELNSNSSQRKVEFIALTPFFASGCPVLYNVRAQMKFQNRKRKGWRIPGISQAQSRGAVFMKRKDRYQRKSRCRAIPVSSNLQSSFVKFNLALVNVEVPWKCKVSIQNCE